MIVYIYQRAGEIERAFMNKEDADAWWARVQAKYGEDVEGELTEVEVDEGDYRVY